VTIASNAQSSSNFYYSDTKAGTPTISASATVNSQAVSGSTSGFTMMAGAANQLSFISTVSGNQASSTTATIGPFVVQVQDQFGNPVTNTGSTVSLLLSTTSAGAPGHSPFFTTVSGGSSAGPVTIASNASVSSNFYYSDTLAGTPTISAAVTVNSQVVGGSTSGFTVVGGPGVEVGIALTTPTVNTSPAISCSGSVGAITCSSTGEANNSGNVLTASFVLEDLFGNPVTNSGTAIGIDLSISGTGTVSPAAGINALNIAAGQQTSSSFTLTRGTGNNHTVILTATVDGTTQTITVTLSS
jgi:hypothetical protein